jgi:hypothetical protein
MRREIIIITNNSTKILLGKLEGKWLLEISSSGWAVNIKMYFKEVVTMGVDWTHLAEDRDKWRALVITIINFRVLQMLGNSWVAGRLLCSGVPTWSPRSQCLATAVVCRAITWQRLLYSCLFRSRCVATGLHATTYWKDYERKWWWTNVSYYPEMRQIGLWKPLWTLTRISCLWSKFWDLFFPHTNSNVISTTAMFIDTNAKDIKFRH